MPDGHSQDLGSYSEDANATHGQVMLSKGEEPARYYI